MRQLGRISRSMMREAMRAPYLERDEEHELAVKWRKTHDCAAMHRIATAHMRLVVSMAAKFRRYGLSMNDLVQEGHIGLLQAAQRFEPDRNIRFSTYASWWIRASIQDYILRNWSIVRGGTSSSQKALFFNLRKLRARLHQGRELSRGEMHNEIALCLGVSADDVALMDSRLSTPDISLSLPPVAGEEGNTVSAQFFVSDEPLPDQIVGDAIDRERRRRWLRTALRELNARELKIIRERRLKEDGATLESLGSTLGISKERVRQIESRALEKLRGALIKAHPEMALIGA
ncbi:RNA polymerase factor sigma-32 [Mesorhizobium xinjiangense]|uniref:RNA polymerase factor sigma-32 n=1 Tax=Mesorhizobium xinjiangense TaxID=2678685 RepID=UPI001F348494|nr:RNA polymerase factor sigma-32 [Mesorhizobium xinjiangense]